MPKYQILRMDREGTPPVIGYTFDDPAEASAVAKKLSAEMGEKLAIKAVIDEKWKLREQARFEKGEYRQLPWHTDNWWRETFAVWKDHFAHPSIERPGWLAYTRNAEDGMKDKQTILRPGAYLKKYFERDLMRRGIPERYLVERFMAAYGPIDIKFAATEEEIILAYDHGPHTCMRDKMWPGEKNPARIYAAGDLQVAYIGDLHKGVKARALVWPEKKIHSRVYGDIARITQGLNRLGYKWGAPIGAKVQKIQTNEVKLDPRRGAPSRCFIAPYIDKKNQAGGGHLSVIEKGDHLVICEEGTPGSHHCGGADGYTGVYVPRQDEVPTFTCEKCGSAGHRGLHEVIVEVDEDGDFEREQWCQRCAVKGTFLCGRSEDRFSTEVEHVHVENQVWAKYYADMYAVTCEMTGELISDDRVRNVVIDGKTRRVSRNWFADNDCFRSELSGRLYPGKDREKMCLHNASMYVGRSELVHAAFQCDGCGQYQSIDYREQPNGDDKLYCPECAKGLFGHAPQKQPARKRKSGYAPAKNADLARRYPWAAVAADNWLHDDDVV